MLFLARLLAPLALLASTAYGHGFLVKPNPRNCPTIGSGAEIRCKGPYDYPQPYGHIQYNGQWKSGPELTPEDRIDYPPPEDAPPSATTFGDSGAIALVKDDGSSGTYYTWTETNARGCWQDCISNGVVIEDTGRAPWNGNVAGENLVCRGELRETPSTTITAGDYLEIQVKLHAAHPGVMSLYISYDDDSVSDGNKRWARIWELDQGLCNKDSATNRCTTDAEIATNFLEPVSFRAMIPGWLPASESAVLRWEWGATHVFNFGLDGPGGEPGMVEIYAACVDVRVVASSASIGSIEAVAPLVKMGRGEHLPTTMNGFRVFSDASTKPSGYAELAAPADVAPPTPTPRTSAPTLLPTARPTPSPVPAPTSCEICTSATLQPSVQAGVSSGVAYTCLEAQDWLNSADNTYTPCALGRSYWSATCCTEATPAPTTQTPKPTVPPTHVPTLAPTSDPTATPTQEATLAPTQAPTSAPTPAPTTQTPKPTVAPTPIPTLAPTSDPTVTTSAPTPAPTSMPTLVPTPKPSSGYHRIRKGRVGGKCKEAGGDCEARCEGDEEVHAVRCCSDVSIAGWSLSEGVWHESNAWNTCERLSFSAARDFCSSQGGRLCTDDEVGRNLVRGTGCGFDANLIWASDECAPPSLVASRSARRSQKRQQSFKPGFLERDMDNNLLQLKLSDLSSRQEEL